MISQAIISTFFISEKPDFLAFAHTYVFLSRLEKELLSDDISEPTQSNLSAEEWKALRGLAVFLSGSLG